MLERGAASVAAQGCDYARCAGAETPFSEAIEEWERSFPRHRLFKRRPTEMGHFCLKKNSYGNFPGGPVARLHVPNMESGRPGV